MYIVLFLVSNMFLWAGALVHVFKKNKTKKHSAGWMLASCTFCLLLIILRLQQ